MNFKSTRGLRGLEIGCGCGSEAERFARAGAHYTAVELTNAAVSITREAVSGGSTRFLDARRRRKPALCRRFLRPRILSWRPPSHSRYRPGCARSSPCAFPLRPSPHHDHRGSFSYEINLRVVRRLRAALLATRFGPALAQKVFGDSLDQLRRHAELIKQDPCSYLDMQNILNRNTDGPDNPLSQVFSRQSARQLFSQFRNLRTEVMFWNPNWLPGIGKLLLRSIEDRLASRWG